MNEYVQTYIKEINTMYQTGNAREHAYRPMLQRLLSALLPHYKVINEPARVDCGAPDFMLMKGDTPMAFVEAKDLNDGDLDGQRLHKEQFVRYKQSLDTIAFTDYLDFHLYVDGEFIDSVRIAEIHGAKIVALPENEDKFLQIIERLRNAKPQKITSSKKLAKLMAAKARLLRDVIEKAIEQDPEGTTDLSGQMSAFKDVLIHDLNARTFADIYAQTIAYGMFAARLYDATPETFDRQEAANLIPKSNPFLRKVFQDIAGYDLDERIAWIVDDLVAAFAATDMPKIMANFGKATGQQDPILHFYEDFLFEYDPSTKKSCGVYYTPQPVVNFIVRAVDEILKNDFSLQQGLADISKVEVEREIEQDKKHKKQKVSVHRVQVLDPATGTGTFLAETVRQIKSNMAGKMGVWQQYVQEHLLPRLHGFELMMAPYTIAHLKLGLEIYGDHPEQTSDKRLQVYLTNSLEEYNKEPRTLFSQWLALEAGAADSIKKDAPIMIMLGNPPYSVSSNNKGEWIEKLLIDYKKNLNERNIQPLSDDYIKFIRLGQSYVERNGEGVLAYISNNSFLDGLIHRQMRRELMRCFDKIYIIDLHGNSRKKETCPDGSKDENVFDIMQGVSINIFVKTKEHKDCEVHHFDLYGTRESKYDFLSKNDLRSIPWTQLEPKEPSLFFVPKDFGAQEEYEKGIKVDELFPIFNTGIESGKDALFVGENEKNILQNIQFVYDGDPTTLQQFEIKDTDSYRLASKFKESKYTEKAIHNIQYRIFDFKKIYYEPKILRRSFYDVMRHMLQPNMALLVPRQCTSDWHYVFCVDCVCDRNTIASAAKLGAGTVFPLYLYPDDGSMDTEKRLNMNEDILKRVAEIINYPFPLEGLGEPLFDYIYGVLHSPSYREKYKEFLKVDFPRVPYPTDAAEFDKFASIGHDLRELHLMHNVQVGNEAAFDIAGTNIVEKVTYRENRVYINETQYFDNVPQVAWNFFIGGYQPAQKWLKDRKGRELSYDDIDHYQKIIAVLLETDRLMKQL
ncbi:MAG: N-6 DNA methylase [Paludibacteraceae bacterium]|nr:N-6 DNA methylase [Paludibacteraceae bacterium]